MKLYPKSERSTFPYWFAHWWSFNKTAKDLGIWKFKYLFHDIEKPWLKLWWKDYSKVQNYHRRNSRHHLTYKGGYYKIDWEALLIDWECSRFSKLDAQLNAFDTLRLELKKHYKETNLCREMIANIGYLLVKYNLCSGQEFINIWNEFYDYRCSQCSKDSHSCCYRKEDFCTHFKQD